MLSHPQDHLFMIEKGFSHSELDLMAEDEFCFYLNERIEIEKMREEALKNNTG